MCRSRKGPSSPALSTRPATARSLRSTATTTTSGRSSHPAASRAWQQRQEQPAAESDAPLMPNDRPTINGLILAYLKHARDYYRPNHGENKEAGCINDALAVL
jgi:hypothetical protein